MQGHDAAGERAKGDAREPGLPHHAGKTLWPREANMRQLGVLRLAEAGAAATELAVPPAQQSASGRWMSPTSALESPRAVAGGGVLMVGVLGQPVRAAGTGRIVYLGSGIRGYGNLIIIKHDESFLSAYAHTREVGVHEGQEVLRGQVIAQMGVGPHQAAALYFEIRLNGKPVDPLPYLSGEK